MMLNDLSGRSRIIIAIISGALYMLAFPPFPFGFLTPISLAAVFLLSITAKSKKEAFLYPFVSGLVSAGGLLYWIPRLMGSGLYVVLIIGMILLLAYMAMWVGLVSLATHQAHRFKPSLAYAVFPIVWIAQEKLREMGEISFPWITAGYSFGSYNTLLQGLSLFGVYFYSLLIAVTAVIIISMLFTIAKKRVPLFQILLLIVLFVPLYMYGHLRKESFEKSSDKRVRVGIIQANIDPLIKWERGRADSIFNLHIEMTKQAALSVPKPDLILWPESALPVYFSLEGRYNLIMHRLIDSLGMPVIFGSLDITFGEKHDDPRKYYNSVFYKAPFSNFVRYDKIKLLPFAEVLPFEGIFPIISRVNLGEADFTKGDTLMLFNAGGIKVFAPICYEVVYQEAIREFVKRGGTLMAHVTNDGWFGRSAMPYQHLNIALFRSIECGIPLARCANTGVSASADACGRVLNSTPIYENRMLIADIPEKSVSTLFTKTGDLIGKTALLLTFLLLICRLSLRLIWKK
ncbi:MAG: apolipoprotein N-acyltransferase [Fibrobacteres bacterium]|nr:apolipoprotein N-acyltransferase [Fibrobacterota bacterium]